MISNLPVELQNKIFLYAAEHPCAKMIKQKRGRREEHKIIEAYDFMFYKNQYTNPMWKVGWCTLCKKNGRKLFYERFIHKSYVCKCCCDLKVIAYYHKYFDNNDVNDDATEYDTEDEDDNDTEPETEP